MRETEPIVEPLAAEQIRLVYPLVRQVEPALGLSSWMRFARRFVPARQGRQAGILVARRPELSFPSGVVCFRRVQDLRFGRVLTADHFVALELLDAGSMLHALSRELDRLGAQLGCSAVRSVVHDGSRELADCLFAAGHRPEAVILTKRIAPGPG